MTLYLTHFSYTPETWARLTRNPEDRREAARKYIESVGGKLHGFWYAFGAYDGYNLWEAPDDVSMAAVAIAISEIVCQRPWRAVRQQDSRLCITRAPGTGGGMSREESTTSGVIVWRAILKSWPGEWRSC